MNTEFDDKQMEEWMHTWQDLDTTSKLPALREAFTSDQWRRRLADVITVIVLLGAVGVCAASLATSGLNATSLLAACGFVVASGLAWKRYQRMRRERSAPPLSPTEYLEASRHNLELLERENRFRKRISVVILPAILVTNIWFAAPAGAVAVATIATASAALLGYAAWRTYIRRPAKLKAERQALDELQREFGDDPRQSA